MAATDRSQAPDSVAQSTVRVLLSYAGTAGFTAVLTFYLVRALGATQFGLFSLAMGMGSLIALPADFGIAASATRFLAERRGDRSAMAEVFRSAARLKLLVAGVVATVTVGLAGPIAGAYDAPGLAWTLRAMAVAVFAQSVMGLFSGSFIAMGRTTANLRMVITESAVECSTSILLVIAAGGAAAAAWGRAIGYVAGLLVGMFLAVRLLGPRAAAVHRRGTLMEDMFRYAGALMIVNGAFTLFNAIDVMLIGAILSSAAVGTFSAPLRLATLLQYPGLALGNSISPRVAGPAPDFAAVQRGLRLSIVIGAALVAPILAWAEPIVRLLLGPGYSDSAGVLRAMTPYLFLQGIGILLALSVNYLGEARRRVPLAIAAVVVNAVIDLLLLKRLGVVGAAIGTSAGYLVYTAGHYAICLPLMRLRSGPLLMTLARSLLAAAAATGLLVSIGTGTLGPAQWIIGLPAAVVAFIAVLLITRELDVGELRSLRP